MEEILNYFEQISYATNLNTAHNVNIQLMIQLTFLKHSSSVTIGILAFLRAIDVLSPSLIRPQPVRMDLFQPPYSKS